MKLLVDTSALMWWLDAAPQLSSRAARALGSAEAVLVSVVTPWELAIKTTAGKLQLRISVGEYVARRLQPPLQLLPVQMRHVVELEQLPLHHRDPFDRMLVAQAIVEGCAIVTSDAHLAQYEVEVVW